MIQLLIFSVILNSIDLNQTLNLDILVNSPPSKIWMLVLMVKKFSSEVDFTHLEPQERCASSLLESFSLQSRLYLLLTIKSAKEWLISLVRFLRSQLSILELLFQSLKKRFKHAHQRLSYKSMRSG
jgi:hypothetical protein